MPARKYFALALPVGVACIWRSPLAAVLALLFRSVLPAGPLADRSPPKPAVDVSLTIKGLVALAAFAGLALAGVKLADAAMMAASALMLAAAPRRRQVSRQVLAAVDWPLLAFFGGLFVVVKGIAHAGALDRVFDAVAPVIGRGDAVGDGAFVALVVVASNVVSNVPLVLVAKEWVPHMADPTWGYVLLAVASTLAGNLTPFGSVANIIVMERAGPRGRDRVRRFVRYGWAVTLAGLVVAFAMPRARAR